MLRQVIRKQKWPITLFGINITVTIFILIFLPYYENSLPKLEIGIFETMVQVISILCGFTLVSIFYYISKIGEQKTRYTISFVEYVLRGKHTLSDVGEEISKLLKAIDTMEVKSPINVNGIRIKDNIKKMSNSVNRIDVVLESLAMDSGESFGSLSATIRSDLYIILGLFSFSILLCFIGIIGPGSHNNVLSWIYLTGIASNLLNDIIFFNAAWNRAQRISDTLDKNYLSLLWKLREK